MRFADRKDAGDQLAARLAHLEAEDAVVLGLPRGGVPVAARVARALDAGLDIWVVRKVGAPSFPEFGLGAVAEGGAVFLNREAVRREGLTREVLLSLVAERADEVQQRAAALRGTRPPPAIEGRTVIVVDDGIATGGTMRVALESLRALHPKRLVLAVPVAATDSLEALSPLADEVVCLFSTPDFHAVGAWYEDFGQTSTAEVRALLDEEWEDAPHARRESGGQEAPPRDGVRAAPRAPQAPGSSRKPRQQTQPEAPQGAGFSERALSIPVREGVLDAVLVVPPRRKGLVIFAHGSGSSRRSVRNGEVAAALNRHGLATLLVDLLTADELERDARDESLRFDIPLLARRMVEITRWARTAESGVSDLLVGYFGSSTGAAAALLAAGALPNDVSAVVSRGGRVDLATQVLDLLRMPILLVVGAKDLAVLELNRRYVERLAAPHSLTIIPGASHLFSEPGALEQVAEESARWFLRVLAQEVIGVTP